MTAKPPGAVWTHEVRLSDIGRLDKPIHLEPDEAVRARIARDLDLAGLSELSADVRLKPWIDGVEIDGRFTARVTYRCGVTLEPYDDSIDGRFVVRAVPEGSPAAQEPESGPDAELSLDSDDPPDVLADDRFDLAAYVVEHLALELDPFPRKPGAVFEPLARSDAESPFAVLRGLKSGDEPSKG